MRVERLQLANLRAIEAAEFKFQPGFNLIVGVNGVGKTTALQALAECLAQVLSERHKVRKPADQFELDDIREGANAFTIECDLWIEGETYQRVYHRQRSRYSEKESGAGNPRDTVHETPDREEYIGPAPPVVPSNASVNRGLGVYFSTRRALPSEAQPRTGKSSGSQSYTTAYSDAFANRELRLSEFASWMKTRQALAQERPSDAKVLDDLAQAVTRFLPGYANLRPSDDEKLSLLVDRDGTPLVVQKLSDGERGTLALVLDLTRRLAQASAAADDPAKEAEAVVLIDEIELHLHPRWQRRVIRNLTEAFPKCQFIATTHSPQVIGEVQNDHIQIIGDDGVYTPGHSYGMRSGRVLEEIMGTPAQTAKIADKISEASEAAANEDYATAKKLLAELEREPGESDPDVTRIRSLISFMEGDDE
ncbi:AAA family ATPase [Adhaeretor mobilis]|uniref:Recombination protein F n=1 Tax=Adhaeretor mobilis TaxID=1930276 RepID=A0A517MWR0_9BACT|nr:AAA family ATPase [Adhaeretor mobilis]QDS99311.1 recombination protein F [Adhaeretor mobilis]